MIPGFLCRSHVTRYERQIKLDTYINKRERKRALKAEKDLNKHLEDVSHSPAKKRGLESDQGITAEEPTIAEDTTENTNIAEDDTTEDASIGIDEDEDMLPSVITEKNGNDPESKQQNLTVTDTGTQAEISELKSKQNNQSNVDVVQNKVHLNNDNFEKESRNNEIAHGEDMEYTDVQQFNSFNIESDNSKCGLVSGTGMEIDKVQCSHNTPQSRPEANEGSMLQGEVLRRSSNNDHRDQSELENVGTFQGLVTEFSELSVWNINNNISSQAHIYKTANWNFEEIKFPDFGREVGEKTVELRRPDGKLLPGHFDLAQESYSYHRVDMINKKATKNLPEDFGWSDEILEFSYPDIMTDHVNVKKSCRNWTEYKSYQYQTSVSWDRSHDLPHLYGDKVRPVVSPEDATSTSKFSKSYKLCLHTYAIYVHVLRS